MTSVERVVTITNLNSEPGYQTETQRPGHWPTKREIKVSEVSLSYYPEGPRVLKDLNLNINGNPRLELWVELELENSASQLLFCACPKLKAKLQ